MSLLLIRNLFTKLNRIIDLDDELHVRKAALLFRASIFLALVNDLYQGFNPLNYMKLIHEILRSVYLYCSKLSKQERIFAA